MSPTRTDVTIGAADVRPCAVIPTYDNPRTIAAVVECVRRHIRDIIVVDDGSGERGRTAVDQVGAAGDALVVRRDHNGGKGAAVKAGLRRAADLGFTHALQIDADGQHDTDDIPVMLAAARDRPEALVLSSPRYDETAPRGRLVGRKITKFWTDLETGGGIIDDPMCGFRVYPLATATRVHVPSDRMDFDIEIAVRLVWEGVPVINLPTKVRYVPAVAGGISHFRMFRDNVRISWLHTRLCHLAFWRWLTGRWHR